MKTQISVFPWANIGQNDHSNPYIESTTVLSDNIIIDVHTRLSSVLCGVTRSAAAVPCPCPTSDLTEAAAEVGRLDRSANVRQERRAAP